MSTLSLPSELIVFADGSRVRRIGVCDGCAAGAVKAACCRYVLLPDRDLSADESRWLALHGLDETAPRNIRIDVACTALTAEGDCSLFGSSERPLMCANYPEFSDLDPGCSYRFERVA